MSRSLELVLTVHVRKLFLIAGLLLCPGLLSATQQSGSVRAADLFIPGATVTATQGSAKVIAYTDEEGRYSLDLTPGVWDIAIEMFGFTPLHEQVTVGAEPIYKNWTLVVPRINGVGQTAAADLVNPTAGRRGGGRGGRGGQFGRGGGRGQGGDNAQGAGRGGANAPANGRTPHRPAHRLGCRPGCRPAPRQPHRAPAAEETVKPNLPSRICP